MIFKTTGNITGKLYLLGHPASPIYLLDGDTPILVDAGLSLMGEKYLSDLRSILQGRSPQFLFLTHAHFDHCGSAGILKTAFPHIKIAASSASREILNRPNALRLIRELNIVSFSQAEALGVSSLPLQEFVPFEIDWVIKEGESFALSENLSLKVMETPGHTRDSLSFYIPEDRMLLCGEALGIPDHTGYIIAECLSDYNHYLASLKKISSLNPKILGLGHYHVFTESDVAEYVSESIRQCESFKTLLQAWFFQEHMDMPAVMDRLKKMEFDGKREDAQPEAAYYLNLKARINAVLACTGSQKV